MKGFRDMMIRRKLTLAMMATSLLTLLIAGGAWLSFDWASSRESLKQEVGMMAEMIAYAASPSIDFGQDEETQKAMAVLAGHENIRRAVIYDPSGRVLSRYGSPDTTGMVVPGVAVGTDELEGPCLRVWRPVYSGNEIIATIAVESDLSGIRERQARFFGVVGLVLAVCLLVAFGVAYQLQELISRPVLRLAETMREVSEHGDFSLRASVETDDEVGFLSDSFNEMLRTIQVRDEALARHGETLEREVLARTEELRQRNRQLKESMAEARAAAVAKSQFLANMSHEIRTPMNGVLGMNALLLDTPLNDQQRSYAELVRNSAESLLGIIGDILDFSKIEAGKMELEEIEFNVLRAAEDVVTLLGDSARKKGLELLLNVDPSIPSVLRGDPTRFRQVLTNLIGNALKFTHEGFIRVRLEQEERTEDSVGLHVSVQDSGIGIPVEQQDRLFQSFSQVDTSTTRKFGGTGLGLAISKQLAEMMGGEIGVESEEGEGSTFWFRVRLRRVEEDALPTYALSGEEAPRVFLWTGSSDLGASLRQQAEAFGAATVCVDGAARLREALSFWAEGGAGKAVLFAEDVLLASEREGLGTFLAGLRRDSGLRIVLLTWQGLDPDCALDGLAGERLSKPVRPSVLFDLLQSNAEKRRARRSRVEEPAAASTNGAPKDLRVLLAEDNRINQLVATKILQKGGYECTVVDDGQEALEAVRGGGFDVVLMDCQMPRMDGFDATAEIRAWEAETCAERRIPIIALTANAMKGDRERCLAAGMDDYVSKPVDPTELLEKLGAIAGERGTAGPTHPEPAAALPGAPFDADDLLARFQGRQDDLRAAIADLDRKAIDCMGRIRSCLGGAYGEEPRALVEPLRQALGLISSEQLHTLAVDLERDLDAGDLAGAEAHFQALQEEFGRCRAYLPIVLARASYQG